jgi:hypothetical protein
VPGNTSKFGLRGHTPRAVAALALTAALAGIGPALAADQPKPPQLSKDLQKPLQEVQASLKANNFADALTKLNAAAAIPSKTPYDQHMINQFTAYACSKTNDVPCVSKALQGQIDDGFTTPDDNQKYTRLVAVAAYQSKNWDQAIDYGNRAIKGGFATDDVYQIVGQAYYLKEDYKGTAQFEEALIADQVKKGQKPGEEQLKLYVSACAKMNDDACINRALERQVAYYPNPTAWYELLYGVRQQAKGDAETLEASRLMLEVGGMKTADDYLEMAQTAMLRGDPGDAQHALEAGTQAGVLTGPKAQSAQRLQAEAKKAAASDQAGLGKTEQEANAASSGTKNAGMGLAYLGYQQYDKAADQLSKAVSKGGLKDEAGTRLLLGVAQLKSGHKDDAVKTFQSVKGSAVYERLASLWLIHAQQT